MYKFACVMVAVAGLASPAAAGNWSIAVPDTLPGGGQTLKSESWQFFLRNTGPGDTLAVLNATRPGQIASISLPDEPRYKSAKRRARDFGPEFGRIAGHLDLLGEGAPVTDVIGLLRHVALARIDPTRPLDLMVVGSAAQAFAETPGLSMRQDDGLYVPSQEHLTASVSETRYGMGAEGVDGLANVSLHLCPVADDLRSDEEAALQGFYAAYVAARGGMLVTWSDDLPTCFQRFAAESRSPIEVAPYAEATGELRMVRVGSAEVVVETEPTTVIVNGIEVEEFNLFASAPHPTLSGVKVTTGIAYAPGRYPDVFENAYCYFNVWKDGVNIRIDLGAKDFERPVTWDATSSTALRSAGITMRDFETGKDACQWPRP